MRIIHALALHWSPLILRHLASKDSETFERLQEQTRASPRMLTRTLGSLIATGLVEHGSRGTPYSILPKGRGGLLVLEKADELEGVVSLAEDEGDDIFSKTEDGPSEWDSPAPAAQPQDKLAAARAILAGRPVELNAEELERQARGW